MLQTMAETPSPFMFLSLTSSGRRQYPTCLRLLCLLDAFAGAERASRFASVHGVGTDDMLGLIFAHEDVEDRQARRLAMTKRARAALL